LFHSDFYAFGLRPPTPPPLWSPLRVGCFFSLLSVLCLCVVEGRYEFGLLSVRASKLPVFSFFDSVTRITRLFSLFLPLDHVFFREHLQLFHLRLSLSQAGKPSPACSPFCPSPDDHAQLPVRPPVRWPCRVAHTTVLRPSASLPLYPPPPRIDSHQVVPIAPWATMSERGRIFPFFLSVPQ